MISEWHLSIRTLFILIPPILLLEGVFAGSEIALLSADKLALKKLVRQGQPGARLAIKLATHPERVLSTTLLITSLCVIAVSSLISLFFMQDRSFYSGYSGYSGELFAIAITSPLVVFIGELIPKTVYQKRATALASWVAYPIYWGYLGFFPITFFLSSYTTRLSRLVGPIEEMLTGKQHTTREELRSVLSYGKSETEIKSSEKKMIKRILDFKDSEAKNALIPLVRVEAVEQTSTIQVALEGFMRHRHSRMPVYSERIDNIVGILEVTDLLTAIDLKQSIRNSISSAYYVAETQSLEDVLFEMKQEDIEMVVVVDEHGGAVGILTFEDIVEEIVGEISDEYDTELTLYKALSETSWIVQAKMEIQQINEMLRLELPEGSYETLSGFLLQQFGRIPESKDELFFNTRAGSLRFAIRKATERHIETVLIEKSLTIP